MDSNIDPSIAEEELFSVSIDRSKNGGGMREEGIGLHHEEHRDENGPIRNVFRLQEYVEGDSEENEHDRHASETASAALNMLQFGQLGEDGDIGHASAGHIDGFMVSNGPFSGYGDAEMVDAEYVMGPSAATVKMVQYNPSEKVKRLGRPRKHLAKNLTPPENSSSQNYSGSVLSKFRFDTRPLEGPGSRGGRQVARRVPRGRMTLGSVMKRKQQSQLNFDVVKSKPRKENGDLSSKENSEKEGIVSAVSETSQKSEDKDEGNNLGLTDTRSKEGESSHDPTPSMHDETAETEKHIKDNLEKGSSNRHQKKDLYMKLASVSRTTVINNKKKLSKQLPGPVIEMYYDLYDDNIINAQENIEIKAEKVALGFPILKSDYADSIVVILSFLNKFKSIVQFQNIGPQDIEQGLSLPPSNQTPGEWYNPREVDFSIKTQDINYVSSLMCQLFSRLLKLAMNKKKDVSIHSKTVGELRSLASLYGLPKEWRDDSDVLSSKKDDSTESYIVDSKRPEILIDESVYYVAPLVKSNPLGSKRFESSGLGGIEDPVDRLILIRAVVEWCLVASDEIKESINNFIQNQDHYAEKETHYGSRAVLRGFRATENVKRDVERKLKRKKGSDNSKYCDPTSDPLQHGMRLRLNEFVVGECGFHVGRFYLCRMADSSSGGISSISKMKAVESSDSIIHAASKFKLYVQDVHSMLTESLNNYGIEYSEKGEVHNQNIKQNYWYEVAANYSEVCDFVDYLAKRLGLNVECQPENIIRSNSMIHKPILNLYNFLLSSLASLKRGDEVNSTNEKVSRMEVIDANDSIADSELSLLVDEETDEVDRLLVQTTNIDDDDDDDDEYKQEDDDDDEYID